MTLAFVPVRDSLDRDGTRVLDAAEAEATLALPDRLAAAAFPPAILDTDYSSLPLWKLVRLSRSRVRIPASVVTLGSSESSGSAVPVVGGVLTADPVKPVRPGRDDLKRLGIYETRRNGRAPGPSACSCTDSARRREQRC